MLFALIVAGLVAAIAVCGVVLVQAFVSNAEQTLVLRQSLVAELAKKRGGMVTPPLVAEHLGITPLEADRLLRTLVDDETMHMAVDDRAGVLRFWYPELTAPPPVSERPASRAQRRATSV